MLAELPQCSVPPPNRQMGTFGDDNECTVRVCLTHSAPAIYVSQFIITTEIASPVSLQGRHLAHCDANSFKFDVWGLFFQVRIGL